MTLHGVVKGIDFLNLDPTAAEAVIQRGRRFYEAAFLTSRNYANLWPGRAYPKDIACVAEGALVYEALLRRACTSPAVAVPCDSSSPLRLQGTGRDYVDDGDRQGLLGKACSLLVWAIKNMQKPDGHFVYRRYPTFPVDLRSIRWGQGMMLNALAAVMSHLGPLVPVWDAPPRQRATETL
jgi:hypothetical protein